MEDKLNSDEKLNLIKEKYNISTKTREKSEFITAEKYAENTKFLKNKLATLFTGEDYKQVVEDCQNYYVLKLWEDPQIHSHVRCIVKRKDGTYRYVNGVVNAFDSTSVVVGKVRVPRTNLVLVKYTSGQIELCSIFS